MAYFPVPDRRDPWFGFSLGPTSILLLTLTEFDYVFVALFYLADLVFNRTTRLPSNTLGKLLVK